MDRQIIPISFDKGLNTKNDPKQTLQGEFLTLENAVFDTGMEIKKDAGYSVLPTTTVNNQTLSNNVIPASIASGNFIAPLNDEIVVGDGYCLYSYSPAESEWVYKGTAPIAKLSVDQIVRNTYSQSCPDSAWNSTTGMFAWEDSSTGGILLSIIDKATGQTTVYNANVSTTGRGPRVVSFGANLVCVYYDTVGAVLKYVYWNGTTLSSPATFNNDIKTTTSVGNHNWTYDLEVHVVSGTTWLYHTYNATGSAGPAITRYDTSFSRGTTRYVDGASDADLCIGLFFDTTDHPWIPWISAAGNAKYAITTPNLGGTTLASTSLENLTAGIEKHITGVYNPDTLAGVMFYDFLPNTNVPGIRYQGRGVTGTIINTTATFASGCELASRAFITKYGTHYIPMVNVIHSSTLQPTYFLMGAYNQTSINSAQSSPIVAKINPSVGGTYVSHNDGYTCAVLPAANNTSTGVYQFAVGQKENLFTLVNSSGATASFSSTGIANATIDFNFTNPSVVNLASEIHYGGGILSMYDGANSVEHGFHLWPEDSTVAPAAGGGHITDGVHGYQFTFEWTDNLGQPHKSAPSPPVSVTISDGYSTSRAVLTLTTLRFTTKSNVYIGIYRTAANGTEYTKVTTVANDFGSTSVTYTDTASDASISAGEPLYTTGGEVDNIAAPATTLISNFKTRVVLIPDDNPYSWWFSKEVINGSPVEFSDEMVENVGSNGGPLTGLKELDSNLILFKENTIYYVSGSGPSSNNANNDFSSPQLIPSDTGCSNGASIVEMPLGLMFQSPKGIYLLNRSQQAQYIGAPVAQFNSYLVTSAVHIPIEQVVRMTLSNGTELIYDYYYNKWSVRTNISAVSSAAISQVYNYLPSTGLVHYQTPGFYADNGSFIKLKLVTGWLNFAGLQSYQRVKQMLILGTFSAADSLNVYVSYDFSSSYEQLDVLPATAAQNPYNYRVMFSKQKCTSIQIWIEDAQQGMTTDVAASISAIALEVGGKKGLNKIAAVRTFG